MSSGKSKIPKVKVEKPKDVSIVGFDITLEQTVRKEGGRQLTADEVGKALRLVAKKFVFQLEEGTEKKIRHYQIRCLYITKTTQANALKLFMKAIDSPDHKDYTTIRPTCTKTYNAKNFSYVMKLDGRIGDVYTDSSFGGEPAEYVHVPRHMRDIREDNLLPFQTELLKMTRTWEYRTIDYIIDPVGKNGKSIICDFLELYENCHITPCINNYQLIIQDCADHAMSLKKQYGDGPESKCRTIKAFICDMPRGLNVFDQRNMISAFETIKSGRLVEYRYRSQMMRIDPPRVFIMCNTCPDLSLLSMDRVNLWTINDKRLVEYVIPPEFPGPADCLFKKELMVTKSNKRDEEAVLYEIENSITPDYS